MKKCAYCKNTILFGGKREGDLQYCNARCAIRGVMVTRSLNLPHELVASALLALHSGLCPRCHGAGPVDVHSSFRAWSMLIVTTWSTRQHVCCTSCGQRARLLDILFCTLLGWWGFPWGLVITPIQIGRNLFSIAKTPDSSKPSAALESVVRMQLALKQTAERQPLAA
ncbi:MAG: hypothetical protein ACRENS_06490 [Candidatus Eiseniibacteriota bacterium]